MASLPDIPDESALVRLFRRESALHLTSWFSLPGGQTLYRAGDPADQLYLVRAGRLGVFRREEGRQPQFLGVIRPGEPAGEMAMVAGAAHSADVVALRDSEIFALSRKDFMEACEEDGSVMIELARLMILRTRQAANRQRVGEPSVYGFVPLGRPGPLRRLVEQLCAEVAALGYSVTVVGGEATGAPTEWHSEVERTHDFVLYVAEQAEPAWAQVVSRQVDRLFRVARGDRKAVKVEGAPASASAWQVQELVDLILLQPADAKAPHGSEAWSEAAQPARLFHLRDGDKRDLARIGRVLTGQSVGLVLSGGGARAYAHIGAIRALHEAGVPIDFVGGVSMGAIIAAGVAMGWDDAEMDRRIRAAFVESSPLDDVALPLLAMTRGEKVAERLATHFEDTQIADLWLPYFCLSSNLTTGAYQLHRHGLLRQALRASISLPGVLPPATDGNNVLVDGAVLKNFPTDVMRALHLGPIVGVDVTAGRSITADDVAKPASIWRWIWSGQWRKGPPIVSLLIRAATVSAGRDMAESREEADVLILPDVTKTEIRDWSAYGPAVAEGYRATRAALEKLDHPVQAIRRRLTLVEQRAIVHKPAAPTPTPEVSK